MNNVTSVIFRAAGGCVRSAKWPQPSQLLVRTLTKWPISSTKPSCWKQQQERSPSSCINYIFPRFQYRNFSASSTQHALKSSSVRVEQGLTFRSKPLTSHELRDVYGLGAPPAHLGNRLLRILHGRRVDGTLDLPLPADVQAVMKQYPYAMESALYWLRSHYEVDEDAAILVRIEREEGALDTENPSELVQRGQNLGLYGPQSGNYTVRPQNDTDGSKNSYRGPQSGLYQARLGKEGDVFGRSELEQIRAENEANAVQEEKELEQQISQITERETARRSQDTALASRPEQGVEVADNSIRPPNEFDKWVLRAKNRSTSKLDLDSPEVQGRSALSRLLPSLLLTIGACLGLYYFVKTWTPPKRSDRVWPNMAMSFATVCGLSAMNVAVFMLWKFPPAWPLLNRYFLLVPATVQPLSLIGSMFSHTKLGHLSMNVLALVVFGPSLHEDLGRAEFLACYLASGIIGNYVSLLHSVSRGIWITSSLGASGCGWGVLAAYCNLHSNRDFTMAFIPEKWQETIHIKGWMLLLGLVAYDGFGLLVKKNKIINYWAHFGGAATGWLFAEMWKRRKSQTTRNGEFIPKPSRPWWQMVSQEFNGRGSR